MSKLPTRKIGSDHVPIPGLGCMGFTLGAGARDEEGCIRVLKEAYELGQTFWETADIYGVGQMGENERLLGKAIKQIGIPRKELFISTRFGAYRNSDGTLINIGDPEYVKKACEASLRNLGLETLDLYIYQQGVDRQTPIEDTIMAMVHLRRVGKIRYIGLSECSVEIFKKACRVANVDALQVECSLLVPDIDDILDACRGINVTLIAHTPLGRGMLAGKERPQDGARINDLHGQRAHFTNKSLQNNLELIETIANLASKKRCTLAQLALAWCHSRWDQLITVPGATSIDQLKENLGCHQVRLHSTENQYIKELLVTDEDLPDVEYPPRRQE